MDRHRPAYFSFRKSERYLLPEYEVGQLEPVFAWIHDVKLEGVHTFANEAEHEPPMVTCTTKIVKKLIQSIDLDD